MLVPFTGWTSIPQCLSDSLLITDPLTFDCLWPPGALDPLAQRTGSAWEAISAQSATARGDRRRSMKAQLPCLGAEHTPRLRLGLHLKAHPGLASVPSLSCFLHSLTVVSWKPFLNKSLVRSHLYLGLFGEHDPRQLSFANKQLRSYS